jgi:DNA-binding MarR family transcriptional regulator
VSTRSRRGSSDGDKRRAVNEAKSRLRALRIELSALSHQVGSSVALKDSDLDALDVIARHGPLSPTALATRMGLHAATVTGILSRLESGNWISREPASDDRRGVMIRSNPARQHEIYKSYAGMNSALDELLAAYSVEELAVIIHFLEAATDAGRTSADLLTARLQEID